jgi:hypothetical protein
MEKWKFLDLPRLELRHLGRPARSQSQYWLRSRWVFSVSTLISHTQQDAHTQDYDWLRYCVYLLPHKGVNFVYGKWICRIWGHQSWVDAVTDGLSWCRPDFYFPFFCRIIAFVFVLGRFLWREDGPVICSTICQWPESWRTHNHTLLSYLRLLGSLSVASYDLQGLRCRPSEP